MNLQLKFHKPNVIDETQLLAKIDAQLNQIPECDEEFMPGIMWGNYGMLYTPAYWKVQYLMNNLNGNFNVNYKLGNSIFEEVVACLLGGFGLKSEIGLAAFDRLKRLEQIKRGVEFSEILDSLSRPFIINGSKVHYRFPNQKAKYIFSFLNRKDLDYIPLNEDIPLRNWLLSVKGIGPKTAAWITRNFLNSEKVAIIDIHIYRACQMIGLYEKNYNVQKDYVKFTLIIHLLCRW